MPGEERGGEWSKGNSLSEANELAVRSGGVRKGSIEEEEAERECEGAIVGERMGVVGRVSGFNWVASEAVS